MPPLHKLAATPSKDNAVALDCKKVNGDALSAAEDSVTETTGGNTAQAMESSSFGAGALGSTRRSVADAYGGSCC